MSVPPSESDYLLVKKPPKRSQFRKPRRDPFSGIIVVHSAESAPDIVLPDTGADRTGEFIRTRSDPGSYHVLSDSDSVLWMVPPWFEAFHDGTGSNRSSVGISCATQAAKWNQLPAWWREGCVTNMALSAASVAKWAKDKGFPVPVARRITKAQSEAKVPGFISHGERDPGRRTDPGADFPWDFFLRSYAFFANSMGVDVGAAPVIPSVAQRTLRLVSPHMRGDDVTFLQQFLSISADGVFGPGTDAAVRSWQKANGLRDDGIVGGDTWTRIHAKLANQAPVVTPQPPQAPNPQEPAVSAALREIIAQIYRIFAAREPDEQGAAYWTSQLAAGMSEDVIAFTIFRAEGLPKIWRTLADQGNQIASLNAQLQAQATKLAALEARPASSSVVDVPAVERRVIGSIVDKLSR